MIPSVLSRQVRQALEEYLVTNYPITTPRFANTVREFVQRGEMFKGPYVSFQLPFKPGNKGRGYFKHVLLPFAPYLHQEQSFDRLTGPDPKPTIVATGTGSGKTESFLYPILDHCRKQVGQRGVKAILIYPMNALANDQARRIAKIIHDEPSLKGKVTAGLYVGGVGEREIRRMQEDSIITSRYAMHENPPDLLLTNYKMLDYLMIQPKTRDLWRYNEPGELRFIVVDELHTFDGAQGTDLACLIRRLKHRLRSPDACPVGTSATLGAENAEPLLHYVGDIFGTAFERDSLITESRLSAPEFNSQYLSRHHKSPLSNEDFGRLEPDQYDTLNEYIAGQYNVWFGQSVMPEETEAIDWQSRLGEALMQHSDFKNLVLIVENQTVLLSDVARKLGDTQHTGHDKALLMLESLLALVSFARHPDQSGLPLLNVRVQFWIRELRRVLVSLEDDARLRWFDDLKSAPENTSQEVEHHMPLVFCRNCGAGAWAGYQQAVDDPIETTPTKIYEAYFSNSKELRLIFPDKDADGNSARNLCSACLTSNSLNAKTCKGCKKDGFITVRIPDLTKKMASGVKSTPRCPHCNEEDKISIFGAQSASLSSVALAQLFGSRLNDDKKAIVFSNSVQDASHRAGFFQGRTYQFAVRTALIQHISKQAEGQSLSDLAQGFADAQRKKHPEQEEYVGTFIAPNLTWQWAYRDLVEDGKTKDLSRLTDLITKRLEYEVFLIFGLQARLGRNLENIRSVTAGLDQDTIGDIVADLIEKIRNQFGLSNLSENRLKQFITGLTYRLRISGGIVHPAVERYIKSSGNSEYLRSKYEYYLPDLHTKSARPAFLSNYANKAFLNVRSAQKTWAAYWATKCLFEDMSAHPFASGIYDLVQKAMVEQKLLQEFEINSKRRAWGIRPEKILITTDLACAKCSQCHYEVCFPTVEKETWNDMPCVRFECPGQMQPAQIAKDDYYRTRYQTYDAVRVVAEEHTGLLERKEREKVEKSFMRNPGKPWDPNVLSCTPTLELGVDIGDLSTVIQTAVAPQKASYLQRIGRAGRRDGNALALTLAAGRPHDLYFFADPMAMMAGDVEVPGIYLQAPAVLKRQLTAFTMDEWVKSGVGKDAVDRRVQFILGRLKNVNPNRFPHNWLDFVDKHAEALFESFAGTFGTPLQTRTELGNAMRMHLGLSRSNHGVTLRDEVFNAIRKKRDERNKLTSRIKAVTKKVKELDDAVRDKNYDRDRFELRRFRAALVTLKAALNTQNVFNFLTDAGILPNYAFPQSSVRLDSLVLPSAPKNGDDKEGPKIPDSYDRPGMIGIRELAPGNTFYAGKRKVKIRQVDLTGQQIEQWRMCENCTYCELSVTANQTKCPHCNTGSWADKGRLFDLVRLSKVLAVSGDRQSQSLDETDERDRTYQFVQTQVQFDSRDVPVAYTSTEKTVPFGFEYLKRATVRQINFGPSISSSAPIQIAGNEQKAHGFSMCADCGCVKYPKTQFRHEYGCKKAGAPVEENTDVFLYHDFDTEAVRILLPSLSQFSETRKIDSFCAALNMGFKLHYGGQLDHLQATTQKEPIEGLDWHKDFAFVFDTVPGGTGYLKHLLAKPDNILKVLRLALDKLKACNCHQKPELDGCYECLFAYRNSYRRDNISRDAAIALLERIVQKGGKLVPISSLGELGINDLLESSCEEQFIHRLYNEARKTDGWSFRGIKIKGETGYELKVPNLKWTIECQVNLGSKQGVPVRCRPDFVLWPGDGHDALPIAVFADGFAYHRDRVADDTKKRMAILASKKFHVWSVTWDDLLAGEKHYEDFLPLHPDKCPSGPNFNRYMDQMAKSTGDLNHLKTVRSADCMPLLFAHLEHPEKRQWEALAYVHALVRLDQPKPDGWMQATQKIAPYWFVDALPAEKDAAVGQFWTVPKGKPHGGSIWARTSRSSAANTDAQKMQVGLYLDDRDHADHKFKPAWNGFLHAMNVLQFLPNCGFFCHTGVDNDEYDVLAEAWTETRSNVDMQQSDWDEVIQDLDNDHVAGILSEMRNWGVPVPEIGEEIYDDDEFEICTALIAWPDNKVAILDDDTSAEDVDRCKVSGWQCILVSELDENTLKAVLS